MTDAQFVHLWELFDSKDLNLREMRAIDKCLADNLYGKNNPNGWSDLVHWLRTNIRDLLFFILNDLSLGELSEIFSHLLHSLILGDLLPAGKIQGVHAADGVRELTGFIRGLDDTFVVHDGLAVAVHQRLPLHVERLGGAVGDDLHRLAEQEVKPCSVGAAGLVVGYNVAVVVVDDLGYALSADVMIPRDVTHGGTSGILLADHDVTSL
jgi:hypothetical protein